MRDLKRYPITQAEKIAVVQRMVEQETKRIQEQCNVGDITVVALREVLVDLQREKRDEDPH